jgi:hypothetical protein
MEAGNTATHASSDITTGTTGMLPESLSLIPVLHKGCLKCGYKCSADMNLKLQSSDPVLEVEQAAAQRQQSAHPSVTNPHQQTPPNQSTDTTKPEGYCEPSDNQNH